MSKAAMCGMIGALSITIGTIVIPSENFVRLKANEAERSTVEAVTLEYDDPNTDENQAMEAEVTEDYREVLQAVLSLPAKYKDVIYLSYYEGYTAAEIGKILGKAENTVYSLLSRGRGMLKEKLGGEWSGQ